MSAPARPLLPEDVQGPLNPFAAEPGRGLPGYRTHVMRPTGWDDPALHPLPGRRGTRHGPPPQALTYGLAPATRERGEANTWTAPHFGLPELPWVDWPDDFPPTASGLRWKTPAVVASAGGRPLALVDDEPTDADRAYVPDHHPAPALLVPVAPRTGLGPDEFTALAPCAAALTAAADRGQPR